MHCLSCRVAPVLTLPSPSDTARLPFGFAQGGERAEPENLAYAMNKNQNDSYWRAVDGG